MPFELFGKKRIQGGPPRVSITKYGNFVLNTTAMSQHIGVSEYAHLYWNADTKCIGIKPIPQKDEFAYHINRSGRSSGSCVGTMAGTSFLRYIGYNTNNETFSFNANWNEQAKLLEFPISQGGKKRRSNKRRGKEKL